MQASVAMIIQMAAESNGWLLGGYLVFDGWLSGEE